MFKITFRKWCTFPHGILTHTWTPKGQSPIFSPILKFGQGIVDAIFVQRISNFQWISSSVLASRRTNFYKILIFGLGVMPQKWSSFKLRAARVDQTSNTHNFWSVGPKNMIFVLSQSLFQGASIQKVSKNRIFYCTHSNVLKNAKSHFGFLSPLGLKDIVGNVNCFDLWSKNLFL
jgi:hypothetical protein